MFQVIRSSVFIFISMILISSCRSNETYIYYYVSNQSSETISVFEVDTFDYEARGFFIDCVNAGETKLWYVVNETDIDINEYHPSKTYTQSFDEIYQTSFDCTESYGDIGDNLDGSFVNYDYIPKYLYNPDHEWQFIERDKKGGVRFYDYVLTVRNKDFE